MTVATYTYYIYNILSRRCWLIIVNLKLILKYVAVCICTHTETHTGTRFAPSKMAPPNHLLLVFIPLCNLLLIEDYNY